MDEWMHAGQDGKTETKVGRKDGITIVPADYQVDERFPWPRLGQEVHPFCGPHVSEEGEEGGAEGEGTIIWLHGCSIRGGQGLTSRRQKTTTPRWLPRND